MGKSNWFKKILLLLMLVTALSLYSKVYVQNVYADLPDLKEISEEEYYGKKQLSKMDNGESLVYAYEQMVEGVGNAETRVTVSNGTYSITSEELKKVYETYMNDYPQHFWIDNGYTYYSYDGSTVVGFSPNYHLTADDLETAKAEFEEGVNELVSGIDASMSEFERELLIHDRIAEKVEYVAEAENAHNAYGAVVDGEAVCDGYSRAFQYALYKVGIQCQTVTGDAGGGHAWNLVEIDDKYYYTDLSWNDGTSRIYHSYFNLPLSEMSKDHTLDVYIELPECNSWEANYFTIFGGIIDEYTVDNLVKVLNKNLTANIYMDCDKDEFWAWFVENKVEIATKCGVTSGFSCGYSKMGNEWIVYIKNATRTAIPVTSVVTSIESYEFENEGDTFKLSATVTPSNAQNQTVTYSSSNTDVAIVNKYTGLVTCVGEGTADIIATAEDNGMIDVCSVSLSREELSAVLKVEDSTETLTKTVGSKITLDAVASGGSGDYTYKFAVLNVDSGVWTKLQDFGSASSYTFALNYTGTKQFAVTVKDSTGKTVATNRITVNVTEKVVPLSTTLSVGGSTESLTKTVGSKITLDAVANGGSGSYTYKFAVLNVDTGVWTALQNYSSNASYTFALNYTGTKQFALTVKDSTGQTVAANRITVKVVNGSVALTGSLMVEGSTAELVKTVGSKITLDAVASGGSGTYTYKFSVLNVDTGKWSALRDFSSNSSYTYSLNYTGTKQFAVTIKDSNGQTVATNRLTVKVTG